ncbi:MAG TPA: YihY/virulence factor BrkB family protein [Microlunatus sp.]|nr:YihY/virulence factor BrkB family protein [Microlunatus sp.]
MTKNTAMTNTATKKNAAHQDPSRTAPPPGHDADRPSELGRAGWVQVAKRGWAEAKTDQVPLLAAGLAYYGFLAIFPALVATVSLYGLLADPAQLADQMSSLMAGLPADARNLIVAQMRSVASRQTSLTVGAIISIIIALWSASGGVSQLLTAISTAYDEEEERPFLRKRGLALLVTLAAIVFMMIVFGLVAVLPALLGQGFVTGPLRWLLEIIRWVLVAVIVTVALAALYRIGPDRDAPKMRWVSVGAAVATVLWLLASIAFSIYVSTFGNYAKTYGAVAGIVVLLLWLWITAYAVLLGAEINAEAEQQTERDSTRGPEQPLGERGAVKADSLPGGGGT